MAISTRRVTARVPSPAGGAKRARFAVLASETFRALAATRGVSAFRRGSDACAARATVSRATPSASRRSGAIENFDPQIDPIVRVEATRLRRTLDRYYAGPGAADRIVFALTRGSYVPVIRSASMWATAARAPHCGPGWRNARVWLAALAAVTALIIIVAVVLGTRGRDAEAPRGAVADRTDPAFDGPLRARQRHADDRCLARRQLLGPRRSRARRASRITLSGTFVEKMRAALVRFDTVNVLGDTDSALARHRKARTGVEL